MTTNLRLIRQPFARHRPGSAICCLAAALLLMGTPSQAVITIQPWTPMYKGVDFTTGQADASEPRLHKVFALRVDLTDPTIEFFSTPSNGSAPRETFGQTTTTFVQTYGVAVGVNANFFSPVNLTPNDPRDLSGLAISQGTIVSPFEPGRPAVTITRSNQVAIIASAPASYNNIWTAVAGSDRVVVQGANTVSTNCSTSFCGPNPRTAVGVSQDGRYFYLIVIDGRQAGWSDGATLVETADWLLRFGAWNGLNLDGGGSTAMARLQGGSAVLLNRPSGGVQRVNGNHLGVFAQGLAPVIVSHPQSQSVNAGSNATFTVTASGAPTLSYRWRLNGNTISGATASSYTRMYVQAADTGNYSVVVSNLSGTATSSNALLTLNLPPGITSQPQNQAVLAGQSAVFSVTATGSAPFQYVWRFNGSDIVGANSSSLTVGPVNHTNAGVYSVIVSNVAGSAASSNASLAVVHVGGWGDNASGQIGIPVDATNVAALAAGAWHSLILRTNGRVSALGNNWSGQCNVPIELSNAVAIAAGGYHSLAINSDGAVLAWGANDYGQRNLPHHLQNVIGIAAGTWHSLALLRDGTVAVWGDNSHGQTNLPPEVTNVIAVAAGGNHSLALRRDGSVAAWGDNAGVQGEFAGQSIVPPGLSNVSAIAAGGYHSLALRTEGTVMGWGDNSENQCSVPVNLSNVIAIAAGALHSLALQSDGRVVAWGANWNGQSALPPTLSDLVGVAAGDHHTLVLVAARKPPARLLWPALEGAKFSVALQTLHRQQIVLEYKNSMSDENWTSLPAVSGNGALRVVEDPSPAGSMRIYRARVVP